MELVGFAFVDDTDLLALKKNNTIEISTIVADLQALVDMWHGCLESTDGALDIGDNDQNYWYCWDMSGIETVSENTGMSVGCRFIILLDIPIQVRRTLGVCLVYDSNFVRQEKYTWSQVFYFSKKML